jgi:hypothetical protein
VIPCILLNAQEPFRTRIFSPALKTLQAGIQNEKFLIPVIELDGNQLIEISFDEMSHENHAYGYQIIHCNADWTPSDIQSGEYLNGLNTSNITEYEHSVNTHYLYTHYRFNLPNNDISFKLSGNYMVRIYEDNQFDKPLAQACFSVVEPKVSIEATVRGNTDTELNGRLQQLDFEVNLNGYNVRDVMTEIKPVIRQNNRFDNEVRDIKPFTYSSGKISYINNKALIFEGGNEFHVFDISSVYNAGRGVNKTEFNNRFFESYLYPDKLKPVSYITEQDVNGRFLINHQEAFTNPHTEADYILVHFLLPAKGPFFDGVLYLGGDLTYNLFDKNALIPYNNEISAYTTTQILKQGGYNYQYRFIPKGSNKAFVEKVDGSFWQTSNEYIIYIYYRAWGERYDKLIGVKNVE